MLPIQKSADTLTSRSSSPTVADSSSSNVSTLAQSALGKHARQEKASEAPPLNDTFRNLKTHLRSWCQEVNSTSEEFSFRLKAKKRIEDCYYTSCHCLDLSGLGLTSLPSLKDFVFSKLTDFNCSTNKLTILPDFSSIMPALENVDCSDNQIEVFPAFSSIMTKVTKVNIAQNRLKVLPDFSSIMPALEEFNCSENQIEVFPAFSAMMCALINFRCPNNAITSFPDFSSKMPALEEFDCSANNLTNFPEFSSVMEALKIFDCSVNSIPTLPDISSKMPALKNFDCSQNLIADFSEFSSIFKDLTSFNCSSNAISSLPDISSQMPALEEFDCSDNNLTSLPNFSCPMGHLTIFDCSSNILEGLPNSMLYWPSACRIDAEHNEFSPAYGELLQNSLIAIRGTDSTKGPRVLFTISDNASHAFNSSESLDVIIGLWLQDFQQAFPKTTNQDLWRSLDETWFPQSSEDSDESQDSSPLILETFKDKYKVLLVHEKKDQLRDFLSGLTKIADYKNASSRNNIIFKVQQFLTSAVNDPIFREHMFEFIGEALSSCDDRIAFYFNSIETQWHVDCCRGTLSQIDLAKLLIGLKRIELLNRQAQGLVTMYSLGDAIETFLYCQVRLKAALKLPLSTEGMLYPGVSGVTEAMLDIAKNAVVDQTKTQDDIHMILCESPYWIEKLKQDHRADFEDINEKCQEDLSNSAEEGIEQENVKLERAKAIQKEQQRQENELIIALTKDWLDKHFSSFSSFLVG